jgi:hypothetical protein
MKSRFQRFRISEFQTLAAEVVDACREILASRTSAKREEALVQN